MNFKKNIILALCGFLLLLVLCVFPFFQSGIWSYLDVDLFGRMIVAPMDIFYLPFQTFTLSGSFFGSDNSNYNASLFGHLILYNVLYKLFGLKLTQIIVFIGVFCLNFSLGYTIAKLVTPKPKTLGLKEGGVFYFVGIVVAFNPVSLWSLWNGGYIFMYSAFLLLFIATYNIFVMVQPRWRYYLYVLLSVYYLIAYPRMGYVLLFSIICLFVLFILITLKKNKQSMRDLFLYILILLASPILYININENLKSGQGLLSYFNTKFTDWYEIIYSIAKNGKGVETLAIFPPNELTMLYSGELWIATIIGIIVTSWLLIYLIGRCYRNNSVFILLVILVILIGMIFLQNIIPMFSLSKEKYTFLAKLDIGFFFADPTTYRIMLILPIIVILTGITLYSKHRIIQIYIRLSILIFVGATIYPIFTDRVQLKMDGLNPSYFQNHFPEFYETDGIHPTYFPQNTTYLLHQGMPYPFKTLYLPRFKQVFTSNPRIGGGKQLLLNELLSPRISNNMYIFNIKDIVVFHTVINSSGGKFDFFPEKDYITESYQFYEDLSNNTGVYLRTENESLSHFGVNNDDSYEYFLYSPASIVRQDMNSFFSGSIDITEKPIVIDPDSFHKPQIVDTYEVPDENKNISIQYKSAILEPTKIYTKITDFDSSKSFLLQLNQTFGMSWRVKWITKEEFEEKPCIDEYKEYPITQNSVCQFKATILDLRDTKYLDNPSVSQERHFEGNFVGNAWLVTPEDIPDTMWNQDELYAVIIYEKQIYYAMALVISGLTFLVLILLTIRESVISYRQQKHDK